MSEPYRLPTGTPHMPLDARIYVAGHAGLVGSALVRTLRETGYRNLLTRSRTDLDLRQQGAAAAFFEQERPEFVFLAAARVGGILANNDYPADFLYDNLLIEANVIEQSRLHGVERLLFLGSSCIYPKYAPQPLREEYLLDGALEPTNEAYAVAKIAGVKLCQAYNRQHRTRYLAVMPTNLYGPGDNFDLKSSHVLPAMIRKFHVAALAAKGRSRDLEADQRVFGPLAGNHGFGQRLPASGAAAERPSVVLWGSGMPRRELLHVDDLGDAAVFLMNLPEETYGALLRDPAAPALVNVGTGQDVTIRELANLVQEVVGFRGPVDWDATKPDGTPRKVLDVSRLAALGWHAKIPLEAGIRSVYHWYKAQVSGLAAPASGAAP